MITASKALFLLMFENWPTWRFMSFVSNHRAVQVESGRGARGLRWPATEAGSGWLGLKKFSNRMWVNLQNGRRIRTLDLEMMRVDRSQKTEAWEEQELWWKNHLSQFLKDDFRFSRQTRERQEDSSSRRNSIYEYKKLCVSQDQRMFNVVEKWLVQEGQGGKWDWEYELWLNWFFTPYQVIQILFHVQ